MHLTALSAGHTVPLDGLCGRVHSVFRRACNIRLTDGPLITLLAREMGDIPQGIRLGTWPGFAFADAGLQAGQRVVCQSGFIRVERSPLQIDLRSVTVWRSDLQTTHVNMADPWSRLAWEAAREELLAWGSLGELAVLAAQFISEPSSLTAPHHSSYLSRRAFGAMRALLDATKRLEPTNAAPAVGSLLGLGPGLTPSGDDFLVGFIAGLWCTTGKSTRRRTFVSGLGMLMASGAKRTTDISRCYLEHAAEGRISETLVSVVKAVGCHNNTETVRQAARNALHVGGTSGADGVAGLLIGLDAWQPIDQGSQASQRGTGT